MFKPFENDTESHAIHDLTLENQCDFSRSKSFASVFKCDCGKVGSRNRFARTNHWCCDPGSWKSIFI